MSATHRALHTAQQRHFILEDEGQWEFYRPFGGLPEQALIDWARQLLRPGKAFIDVGAHCGTWALQYASANTPVFAYEPQWSTFCQLCGGIALNRLEAHVTAIHAAVCEQIEPDPILLHVAAGEGGGTSLTQTERAPVVRTEYVRALSLDSERARFGVPVGLIKVDVEGAEARVLQGAISLLAEDAPYCLVECWDSPERSVFFEQVERLHYRCVPLRGFPEMWLLEPRRPAKRLAVSAVEDTSSPSTQKSGDVAEATSLWGGKFQSFGDHLTSPTNDPLVHSIPSVCVDGRAIWVSIRWINYSNDVHGWECRDPQGIIRSVPEIVRLEPDRLQTIARHVLRTDPAIDKHLPIYPTWTRGFEDLRLFRAPNTWCATATATDRNPHGQSEMFLLHMTPDSLSEPVPGWTIHHAHRLLPPRSEPNRPQKNWVPICGENQFIYQTDVLVHGRGDEPPLASPARTKPSARLADLRGSSQAIVLPPEHGGGWLYVGHHDHPASLPHLPHPVSHRLVQLDTQKRIVKASPPFCFRQREAVEYCAGIAIYDDELLFSFSVQERHLWMHRAPLVDVLASLVPVNDL